MQNRYWKLLFTSIVGQLFFSLPPVTAQNLMSGYAVQPVDFTRVHLTDDFWQPRLQTNARVTIPFILEKCLKMEIPVMINSDAHKPEQLTLQYKEAVDLLKNVGFKELFILDKTGRKAIDINEYF